MILYELFPNKLLKKLKDEDTFVTENLISSFNIIMPSTFGNYPSKELDFELRVYLPTVNNGQTEYSEYMGYPLTVENNRAVVPITNDITGDVQIDKVMILATKDGNVIGKTNFVDKPILDAPLKGEPLTPREQFDEVIREQRETIAEQDETITEQGETITQQGEQITELNGEVTELTTENTRLENLTETQRQTIQNMIDNPPAPELYTPPVVTPSGQIQQITAPEGYDGLTECTVDRVTAEVDSDIQPQNIKEGVDILGVEGTYNPFPEHSVGGIYITEVDEDGYPVKFLIKSLEKSPSIVTLPTLTYQNAKSRIREIVFENCPMITGLPNQFAYEFINLSKVILPENFTGSGTSGLSYQFGYCESLKEINLPQSTTKIYTVMFYQSGLEKINLPSSITSIGNNAFCNCTSLTNLTLAQGFNCNGLDVHWSTRFTAETIVSCLEALADRTGQTAYTITFGTTNLNKLTAEEKAIATNKNWNLA